jgi:hypothetical protein
MIQVDLELNDRAGKFFYFSLDLPKLITLLL